MGENDPKIEIPWEEKLFKTSFYESNEKDRSFSMTYENEYGIMKIMVKNC